MAVVIGIFWIRYWIKARHRLTIRRILIRLERAGDAHLVDVRVGGEVQE
jgi:hypothetical protein